VGAVVVANNRIIARAHNLTEQLNDVTAHAEMQAITAAANVLGGKYLTDCTLYVTVEPCPMCAGALRWAQLTRLVYGAKDEKGIFAYLAPPASSKDGCYRRCYGRRVRRLDAALFRAFQISRTRKRFLLFSHKLAINIFD